MNANEALIKVEEGLARITTPVARRTAFAIYADATLPRKIYAAEKALIDQGFDAGYAAATRDANAIVGQVLGVVKREGT